MLLPGITRDRQFWCHPTSTFLVHLLHLPISPLVFPSDTPSTSVRTAMDKTCPDCGRVFTKAAHLTRHRLTHDQQRPFSCTACGKAFARPDALQRHMRTLHGKRQRTGSEAQSDAVTPPSSGFDLSATDPLGSLGFPPLFPLPVFANTSTPTTQSLDEMVAGWLSQDGGALATENALAAAFSDQVNWEPDLTDTFYTEPQEMHREPRRRMMNADTWESGMSNPQHQDVSRPASPPPREITSPEEVVAELHINHTVSCSLCTTNCRRPHETP